MMHGTTNIKLNHNSSSNKNKPIQNTEISTPYVQKATPRG